jgi:tetratricopeptide (TPR) repeat protein
VESFSGDKEYVDKLVGHLAGHRIAHWRDKGIEPGTARGTIAIRDHIDNCAASVLVMTPAAEESEWVGRDVRRAQTQSKPILPLLLDGYKFLVINEHQYDDVSDGRMPSPRLIKRRQHLTFTTKPSEPVPARPSVADWIDEANRLWGLGDFEKALVAADRALELSRSDAAAHFQRGRALAKLGRSEEALAANDRAIALDPNFSEAHSNPGIALRDLGRYEEALATSDRARELDSNLTLTHNNRESLLCEPGR